ncbi:MULTISPECIES: FmdB family zinc ribbon protein [unclassified Arthrobacter]|uniref:FmdB family zinc ribbon protein n=1 Tax=unclassified Arthrobacter TaxID=235627 RepID=UPI0004662715|nr:MULTISPECIES: FmdB family zinc ribbon protein [unclassified Arthrobacter]PVE19047.1 FmdB family transcriptional regulator [Arthrobacter sp. Bz4]
MPTYAYACRDCEHAFDIHQAFSDNSLTVCPECDGSLRKKFNSVGVVFKGSGFYRNDSRDSKKSVDVGASNSVASTGSGSESSSSSSENKPSTTGPGKDASPAPTKSAPATKTTAAAS